MNKGREVTIRIGPLALRYWGDDALLSVWPDAENWQTEAGHTATYSVHMTRVPALSPEGRMVYDFSGLQVYLLDGRECRYYYYTVDPQKKLFARSFQSGPNTVELSLLEGSAPPTQNLNSMVGIEHFLLKENAFLLHSASVIYQGKAILFSAPSGTGKSTQADLWKRHTDASPFNGDRNLLWKRDGQWVVTGSPWHGTSTDCVNVCVPLRAIAVLRQAMEDSVRPLSPVEKMLALHSETTVNRWNAEDVAQAFELAEDLANNADIVGLDCTMEPTAVWTLRQYLEEKPHGTV
ncbi:MAG: hypothetical protein LUC39_01815 [Clostridiales bacterium]|nr:hypothetical protein [Clostridiales bacterium]